MAGQLPVDVELEFIFISDLECLVAENGSLTIEGGYIEKESLDHHRNFAACWVNCWLFQEESSQYISGDEYDDCLWPPVGLFEQIVAELPTAPSYLHSGMLLKSDDVEFLPFICLFIWLKWLKFNSMKL